MPPLKPLQMGRFTLDFDRTLLMGIVNVTPDSFSEQGRTFTHAHAISHAKRLMQEGADIIDIGGESSRPGAKPVSEQEELRRILPVVKALAGAHVPLSIDTYKPNVAKACLEAGAVIINDITGLQNDDMVKAVKTYGAGAVIMHMQGTQQNMQNRPQYGDVVAEVAAFLKKRASAAKKNKISSIIIDPGIGFGKTVEHNLRLLEGLPKLCDLGFPVMVGVSRKSFIGTLTETTVENRLEGTIAANTAAILNGANIVRVHSVSACKKGVQIADAIKRGGMKNVDKQRIYI